MTFYKYALEYEPAKSGRSQAYDLNCSYKDLTQVLGALKGSTVAKARQILDECIEMKKAIPFRKFSKGMGHRSELGGKKGKYPKKEAKLALELLNNAVSNAKGKGLDEKNLVVLHACAYKQNVFPRYRKFFASSTVLGYGKHAMFSVYMTARAEFVVGEQEAKKLASSPRTRAKENRLAKLEPKAAKKKAVIASASPAKKEEKKEAKSEAKPQAKPKIEAKEEKHEHTHDHSHEHAHASTAENKTEAKA